MKNEITLKNYLFALLVLAIFGIVLVVGIVSIPYLFYLMVSMLFTQAEFGILFIVYFWLSLVFILWINKLIFLISGRYHS